MILKISKYFIFLFIIFLLVACQADENISNPDLLTTEGYPVDISVEDGDSGYPDPNSVIEGYPVDNLDVVDDYGYPGPNSTIKTINIEDIVFFPTAPEPDPGLGSMSAILYTPIQSQVISNTAFYLMPAIGENNDVSPIISGPDEKQGDIHGFTDSEGFLIVNNINPDKYYLVVWSPYDWVLAENEEGKPLLIDIIENSKKEMKIILVQWP